MATTGFDKILRKNNLKVTAPRIKVLEKIIGNEAATSQPALEKSVGDDIDRVTLYRILKAFEEKGILHKVIDLNGTANYAFCSSNCTSDGHQDKHFHFNCTICLRVYCMNDIQLPPLALPAGFRSDSMSLTISGTCNHCS